MSKHEPQRKLRSMDQERAEFALGKIEQIAHKSPDAVQIEVRRYLNSLPALIRMNGLGRRWLFIAPKILMGTR